MEIKKLLDVLHVGIDFDSDKRIANAVKLINDVQRISYQDIDVLNACFEKGPLYDGDVPSKSGRDNLLDSGYISKIVVNGEEGFNACTYKGAQAYRLIKAINNNPQ